MTINWGALSVVAAISLVIGVLVVVLVSLALVGTPPPANPSQRARHWSSLAPGAAGPAPQAR